MAYLQFGKTFRCNTASLVCNAAFRDQNFAYRCYATPAISQISKDKDPLPSTKIPGFKIYPIVGSALSILRGFDNTKLHLLWRNCKKKFGPVIQLKMPFETPMVALFNPDDIEKVYRATTTNPRRHAFHALKNIRDNAVNDYFEKKGGLLVENNEEWWRVRSKVQTPMMKPKNLVKYLHQMDEVNLLFMDRIADLQEKNGEMPNNFQEELYKWALESVGVVALSRRIGCLDENLTSDSNPMKIINAVKEILDALRDTEFNVPYWRLYPTAAYKKLKANHDIFLRLADQAILETEEALKMKSSGDLTLLETLLRIEGLTRKDVLTMILDMLFAGIDTTSHTIAFTLYCLAKNPEVQKRLQAEVDSVLGNGADPISDDNLARLSYLKQCVKEAMRCFPLIIAHVRHLEVELILSGYHIPKDSQALIMNAANSLDENLFPRAKEYLPERWSKEKPFGPIHPFASLPFSYGPRMCIGRRIAEQEMYTFLARIAHRYQISYKYDDIELITGLVSTPSQPLRFAFKERKDSSRK